MTGPIGPATGDTTGPFSPQDLAYDTITFLGGSNAAGIPALPVPALGNEAFVAGLNSFAQINNFEIPGLGAVGSDVLDLTVLLDGLTPSELDNATALAGYVQVGTSTPLGNGYLTPVTVLDAANPLVGSAKIWLGTANSISTFDASAPGQTTGLTTLYPALILPPHGALAGQ